MQKTIISWAHVSWNPASGCSKVSDGCKFCYAMTLSEKYGWTDKPWTVQNEEENVVIKPHKLHEPYLQKTPVRVFVNSMSDLHHRAIPDWYRAAVWCVMLDTPQHIYQVLTKRADSLPSWNEHFLAAVRTDNFRTFRDQVKRKDVRAALDKAETYTSAWGENIWQGISVEDGRVLHRIDSLRACDAKVRFISAEPLLGDWGESVDLTDIHWVIAGGESGMHFAHNQNRDRWLDMAWARRVRDLCVRQGVAFFMKQDSGVQTEQRKFLLELDGSRWEWAQFPGNFLDPKNLDTGESRPAWTFVEGMTTPDNDPPTPGTPVPPKSADISADTKPPQTRVVSFRDVKDHWDAKAQRWDSDEYVYIGRTVKFYNMPQSKWHNPYRDPDDRHRSPIDQFRIHITKGAGQWLKKHLDEIRGKTLVCWCKDKAHPDAGCHGDVLLELLGEPHPLAAVPEVTPPPAPFRDTGTADGQRSAAQAAHVVVDNALLHERKVLVRIVTMQAEHATYSLFANELYKGNVKKLKKLDKTLKSAGVNITRLEQPPMDSVFSASKAAQVNAKWDAAFRRELDNLYGVRVIAPVNCAGISAS